MTATPNSGNRTARPTRLAPGTTTKRLPWLDGKTSNAVSIAPAEDDPSPTTRPSSRKPSILTIPKRTATAYTTTESTIRPSRSGTVVRKKLVSSPTEHRMLTMASPLESSPSPVTRHRMAQSGRESTARQTTSYSGSITRDPRKRLSIVDTLEPSVDGEIIYEQRARADSLAPVPDHLERSSTSELIELPVQRDIITTSNTPVVVSRVQMSPSRPRPGRNAFEKMGDRRISNAIEGLEDMVQEAVHIADDTADHGQVEEIYGIIEDARQAIQEASGDPARRLMVTSSPLPASDSSHHWVDYGGYPRDLSPLRPGRTPPLPPLTIERHIIDDSADLVPSQVQIDVPRGSASVDWAYQPHQSLISDTSSSSRSTRTDRGRSRLSTRSDLLLPPDPTQAAPREHVDLVIRPMARDYSRGRPNRRVVRKRAVRSDRPHRHHWLRSSSPSDRELTSRSDSRHRSSSSSESSPPEESFDEEELPPQQYGETLRVREQAQHTFNLRRHHRRQPIARNWGTGKKRLTAIIACINTALLGIIIGVYVSCIPRWTFLDF
jgi:hypothetical protein